MRTGPITEPINELLRDAVESGVVPGVVAAVTDRRETRYLEAFGVAEPGRPLREDGVFRIASMTKPATSLAVMMLHEEGALDIERPLAEYLPGYAQPPVLVAFDAATRRYETRRAGRAVTVRQLLTHTSGYGYWFLDAPLLALTRGRPELVNPPFLMHEPGGRFAYGTSMDVLGQVIEPVSGRPLERFLHERIFEPLGMNDTAFAPPPDARRLVRVHRRAGEAFDAQENEHGGGAPTGGTGLHGTAADYLALIRLFLNRGVAGGARLAAAATIDAMTRNQVGPLDVPRQTSVLPERTNDFVFMDGSQKFGLGFLMETRGRPGGRAAGSYGWAGIFNTFFWADPRAGVGAVLMMQLAPFCDPACVALLERFERAVYAE